MKRPPFTYPTLTTQSFGWYKLDDLISDNCEELYHLLENNRVISSFLTQHSRVDLAKKALPSCLWILKSGQDKKPQMWAFTYGFAQIFRRFFLHSQEFQFCDLSLHEKEKALALLLAGIFIETKADEIKLDSALFHEGPFDLTQVAIPNPNFLENRKESRAFLQNKFLNISKDFFFKSDIGKEQKKILNYLVLRKQRTEDQEQCKCEEKNKRQRRPRSLLQSLFGRK